MKNVYLKSLGKNVKVYEHGDPDIISVGDVLRGMEYVCSRNKANLELANMAIKLQRAAEENRTLSPKQMDEFAAKAQYFIELFTPYSIIIPEYKDIIEKSYDVLATCNHLQAQGKELQALDKFPVAKIKPDAANQWYTQRGEYVALVGEAKEFYGKSLDMYSEKKEFVSDWQKESVDEDIREIEESIESVSAREQQAKDMVPEIEKTEKKGFFARLRGK